MSVPVVKKPSRNLKKKFNPHKYQQRCIAKGINQKYLGYFLDPGLGKTSIILLLFKILKNAGLVKGLLVIAPKRPCFMVWPKELKKWSDFCGLSMTVLHNEWRLNKEAGFKKKHDIYVMNPEGLPWLLQKLKGKRRESWPFDMLCVDESTKFKDTSTKRFKNLKKIVPKLKRRYILTGTPIPNGLLGIQGQMFIVDQGESLGSKANYFKTEYFKQVGKPEWNKYEIRSKEHEEKIYQKVAKYIIRLKAEDYLELPERVDNIIEIDLPKKVRKKYNELENELFTYIENEDVDVPTAAALGNKLRQIANGRLYADQDPLSKPLPADKRKVYKLHEEKLNALEELVEELDNKPVLIGYWFRHDLAALQERFKKKLVNIGSGVSMQDCIKIEKQWNQGKIKMLAAFPGSAALGLNLQESGHDIFFYSMLYDLEAYDQFIRRILRQGVLGNQVRVHHPLA
ncbi:MAG: DEAD/DEAH box helicase, partial [Salegentibacter mishustinae]|nr:DEAD/DEAH box helicase [Salegentibacter mishustinae]